MDNVVINITELPPPEVLIRLANPDSIPEGGDPGQVLAKVDGQDYHTAWIAPPGGDVSGLAPIDSPVFTGDPQAPTPPISDNDDSIATTNFVNKYVQTELSTVIRDQGSWDASGNAFPSAGGSGSGGAIQKGNQFTISVSGVLGGTAVTSPYSIIRALVDFPGQDPVKWFVEDRSTAAVSIGSRKYLFWQNTDSAVTGTTNETILTPISFLVPAGSVGPNSTLQIKAFVRKNGIIAPATFRVLANTSFQISGAKQIFTTGGVFLASYRTMGIQCRITNKNSSSTQNVASISSFSSDTPSTNPVLPVNIDFSVNQYVFMTAQLGNSADTAILDNVQIYIDTV